MTGGGHLSNLMGLALSAQAAGNNQEAIEYFNRVLEDEPTASEAWYGKGKAAGWLSSLANVRTPEVLVAFGHAIATAPDGEKQSMAARAHAEVTKLCTTIYGMARKHFLDHQAVVSAQSTYLAASSTLIDALAVARDWQPIDRPPLELMVQMTRELIDFGLTPESAAAMRRRMDEANGLIASIDPGYVPQPLAARTLVEKREAKATSDALGYIVCFVLLIVLIVVGAVSRS